MKALGSIFEALGFIFDVLLVPGWPNGREWPQVSKKGAFFYEKLVFWGSFWGSIFGKSRYFKCIFEDLTWGWYSVSLLKAHGCQNVCFLRWLTFTEHSK